MTAPADEPRNPDLEGVLRMFGESLLYGVRVSMPGRVTAYDADAQTCSVQPLIRDSHLGPDNERVADTLPEVHDAPVFFPGNARGRLTYPVAAGDTCLILWASSSIARWVRSSGGIVDPGDDRRHDLNDAVVLVGLHTAATAPTPAPSDAVVLHAGDGVTVKLGGATGTQPTIRANAWEDAFDLVVAAIAGLPGGAAVSTAWDTFKLSGYKTTKTEVK